MSKIVSLAASAIVVLLAVGFLAVHGLAGTLHDVIALGRSLEVWTAHRVAHDQRLTRPRP